MKNKLGGVFVTGVIAFSLFGALAVAQNGTTDANTASEVAERTKRLNARKASLKLRLTAAQTKVITTKCKAAQTNLGNLKSRTQTGINKRFDTYTAISAKLKETVAKMQTAGVDTAELKGLVTQFDTSLAAFKVNLTAYNFSLDDLIAMDCAADPIAFKATLESLRTQRAQLGKDAAGIRGLQPKLSKALSNARILLANKTQTGEGNN